MQRIIEVYPLVDDVPNGARLVSVVPMSIPLIETKEQKEERIARNIVSGNEEPLKQDSLPMHKFYFLVSEEDFAELMLKGELFKPLDQKLAKLHNDIAYAKELNNQDVQ